MDKHIARLAAAGAVAGLLGVGGISIAAAQDGSDSTSTTVEQQSPDTSSDSTTADAQDREDCPDKAAAAVDAGPSDASS